MERVLIVTGDAGEELEIYYVLYRLREAGYEVEVAAPTRKRLKLVVHDFEDGNDAYLEIPGRGLDADVAFAEVDPGRYAALVIPGGRAPEYIRMDEDVRRIVAHFYERELPVGLMCHGPQVPAVLGLLEGRTCAGFPPLGPDLEAAGATYRSGVVVDGNMVSCDGWPDLAEWSKQFVEVLDRAAVAA